MSHIKLLSFFIAVIIIVMAMAGKFGALICTIVGWALLTVCVVGVYFLIHELVFGTHPTGNGFD